MLYACTADTDGHGRCRNASAEGDKDNYCVVHAKSRDSGKEVKKATSPTTVLVKAQINPRWADLFTRRLGIPVKTPDFVALNAKHEADASAHGRAAYAIRKNIADSGVQVFGKEGAMDVLVVELFDTLLRAYHISDMHVFQRRDKGVMNVLVITFVQGVDVKNSLPLPLDVAKFFAMSKWGFCHVWANPPKADRSVLHTVNLSHRSDEVAKRSLAFADGLWAVEKIE